MIVHEVQQMLTRVEVPRVASALTLERIGDLMHIRGVHRGPESLIRLVVRDGVAQLIAHPKVVVAEHRLAKEKELIPALLRDFVGNPAKVGKESPIEAIRNVEPQAIDAVIALPSANHIGKILIQLI